MIEIVRNVATRILFCPFSARAATRGGKELGNSSPSRVPRPGRALFLKGILLPIAIAALSLSQWTEPVQGQAPAKDRLYFTVVLSRHGVRTPTNTPDQLQEYVSEPWPVYNAPTGFLTPRGARLMRILGAYYREYFIQDGLLAPNGCQDLGKIYFWADNVSRDVDSAWNLGRGMMPDCDITVHKVAEGKPDPLFSPQAAGVGKIDFHLASDAFVGALGGSPDAIINGNKAGMETLNRVLFGCRTGVECPAAGTNVKKPLMKQPALTFPVNATATSPLLSGGHSVADALLCEYLDGMNGKLLGWGRLDDATLYEIRKIHARYVDALLTSYKAKAEASNLFSHILRSLEQAERGTAVAGSVGNPGDKALILLGHDYDILRIARLLGVSWEVEKGLPKDVPPGCSLIFELWHRAGGQSTIRVYFQTQTFDQLRKEKPLTLKNPPGRTALAISACSADSGGAGCTWERFRAAADSVIDPAFVAPPAATSRIAAPASGR